MRLRGLVVAAIAGLMVAVAASPASAKGADQATITGPGLAKPIVVGGDGEPGSTEGLGQLSEGAGLYTALFGPDSGMGQPLAEKAPAGDLGPKYQISFRLPGGNPKPDVLKQDLYPMAPNGPVTYTTPGQVAFDGTSYGGWYQGPASLTAVLKQLGVPFGAPVSDLSPTTSGPATSAADVSSGAGVSPNGTPWVLIVAIIGAVVVVSATAVLSRRLIHGRDESDQARIVERGDPGDEPI
jgi:hypothetical protein